MNRKIEKRVLEEAYIIKNTKMTIRELAQKVGVGKSTVHKDMQTRLPLLDKELNEEVQKIFAEHLKTRHHKGGLATQKKYKKVVKK